MDPEELFYVSRQKASKIIKDIDDDRLVAAIAIHLMVMSGQAGGKTLESTVEVLSDTWEVYERERRGERMG